MTNEAMVARAMEKEKSYITGTDIGILCSAIGIIACMVLISFMDDENRIIGVILLCVCIAGLLVGVKNKKIR